MGKSSDQLLTDPGLSNILNQYRARRVKSQLSLKRKISNYAKGIRYT